jgi:hypothetical protein
LKVSIDKFNGKLYLNQLDDTLDNVIKEYSKVPEDILLAKYEVMKLLDYTEEELHSFLFKYRSYEKVMKLLVDYEINANNISDAIKYLNEKKDIYGNYSFEDSLSLYTLYKLNNDRDESLKELKTIIYDFNVKDMFFVNELKEVLSSEEWNSEKEKLVTFYSDNYSYDFLNQIYVEEEDIENLFNNIVDNCRIELIEEYSDYIKDAYNDQILSIYYDKVLKDARDAKNISSYNLIINYLDLMLNYNNSFDKVKKIIEILKNKYYQRKLFMEKISEFEILHSLN